MPSKNNPKAGGLTSTLSCIFNVLMHHLWALYIVQKINRVLKMINRFTVL